MSLLDTNLKGTSDTRMMHVIVMHKILNQNITHDQQTKNDSGLVIIHQRGNMLLYAIHNDVAYTFLDISLDQIAGCR